MSSPPSSLPGPAVAPVASSRGPKTRARLEQPPLTVGDPREELLLERVVDVTLVGEPVGPRPSDQLEDRLAEALLEVLARQAAAMDAQQQVPLGGEHGSDALGGIVVVPAVAVSAADHQRHRSQEKNPGAPASTAHPYRSRVRPAESCKRS
jgi:hypothetical protein